MSNAATVSRHLRHDIRHPSRPVCCVSLVLSLVFGIVPRINQSTASVEMDLYLYYPYPYGHGLEVTNKLNVFQCISIATRTMSRQHPSPECSRPVKVYVALYASYRTSRGFRKRGTVSRHPGARSRLCLFSSMSIMSMGLFPYFVPGGNVGLMPVRSNRTHRRGQRRDR